MNTQIHDRLLLMRWVIDGLSVGDAFGESLFFRGFSRIPVHSFESMITKSILPASRWEYTDFED